MEQESEVENELKLALEEACLELGVTLSAALSPTVSLSFHHTGAFFYLDRYKCTLHFVVQTCALSMKLAAIREALTNSVIIV